MTSHKQSVSVFETIEQNVISGSIASMSLKELRDMKRQLLAETPTSENPKFQQRWERAHIAVSSRIDGIVLSRRFRWQISFAVITLLFVLVNLYLTHWRHSDNKPQQTPAASETPNESKTP